MNCAIELTTQVVANDYSAGTLLNCSERGLRIFTRRLLWKGERVTVYCVSADFRALSSTLSQHTTASLPGSNSRRMSSPGLPLACQRPFKVSDYHRSREVLLL